jgi:NAD(P) transhydrogenase subunit alpha
MDTQKYVERAAELATDAKALATKAESLANEATGLAIQASHSAGIDPTIFGLTVFVLACFVGYYVVWRVTPALHSPLRSVTHAVSSVIVVGALIAAGPQGMDFSKVMGFLAVILASVNIFGGFIVTQRMLQMFKKKS